MPTVITSHDPQTLAVRLFESVTPDAAKVTSYTTILCLIWFASLLMVVCLSMMAFQLFYRRTPPLQYFLGTRNLLVLVFTWPYHVRRFFLNLERRKDRPEKTNQDVERGVKPVVTVSDREVSIQSMPRPFGAVGIGTSISGPPSISNEVPIPGPANVFTPQHLHSQTTLDRTNTNSEALPQTRLASPHAAYLAMLPFGVRPGQPSSASEHASTTISPLTATVSPALPSSAVSPLEPRFTFLEIERNIVGGENADYFQSEGQWMSRKAPKDPTSILELASPAVAAHKRSLDTDSLESVLF